MLTKSQIFEKNDLPTEEVDVPEWGGSVFVRKFTSEDKDNFDILIAKKSDEDKIDLHNLRAKLCVFTIVDEDGKCLFSEEDVEALGRKSATAIERIFTVSQRLNNLGLEAVKEIEKNSESGQSEDSGST